MTIHPNRSLSHRHANKNAYISFVVIVTKQLLLYVGYRGAGDRQKIPGRMQFICSLREEEQNHYR